MNKVLGCYKCNTSYNLLVEEKVNSDTGEVIEKNFICADCANLFKDMK